MKTTGKSKYKIQENVSIKTTGKRKYKNLCSNTKQQGRVPLSLRQKFTAST